MKLLVFVAALSSSGSSFALADGPAANPWVGTVITTMKSVLMNPGAVGGKVTITNETTLTIRIPDSGPAQAELSGKYSEEGVARGTFQALCHDKFSQETSEDFVSIHGIGQQTLAATGTAFQPSISFDKDGTYSISEGGGGNVTFKTTGTINTHSSNPCANPQNNSTPMNGSVNLSGAGGSTTETYTAGPSGELPKSLSGQWTNPMFAGTMYSQTMTWNLTRGPSDVHAKTTKTTYPVDRGQLVILDASPSTGPITEYKWTLQGGSDCGSIPPPETEMKGKQIAFTALCSINAKLTVSDDSGSDMTPATVKVNARKNWKTKVGLVADDPANDMHPEMPDYGEGMGAEGGIAGKNRCSFEKTPDGVHHWIHHSNPTSWIDDGYKLVQINEPNAPFNGYWYVQSQSLEISRRVWINSSLLSPNGRIAQLNAAGSAGNPADLTTLLASTREHEAQHTILVQNDFNQSGPDWDPAARIEKVFGEDKQTVTDQADGEVRIVESELGNTDWDSVIETILSQTTAWTKSGWVLAPSGLGASGETAQLKIPSFAGLGVGQDQY